MNTAQEAFTLTALIALVSITPQARVKLLRRRKMTDLDPEIWENDTLGAAAPNKRLDVEQRQEIENHAAKVEGREPREIVSDETYPGWAPEVNPRTGTVPSNYQTVHFADEQQNDIPVDSGEKTAQEIAEEQHEENISSDGDDEPETEEPGSEIASEVETVEPDSNEESDSTKW